MLIFLSQGMLSKPQVVLIRANFQISREITLKTFFVPVIQILRNEDQFFNTFAKHTFFLIFCLILIPFYAYFNVGTFRKNLWYMQLYHIVNLNWRGNHSFKMGRTMKKRFIGKMTSTRVHLNVPLTS